MTVVISRLEYGALLICWGDLMWRFAEDYLPGPLTHWQAIKAGGLLIGGIMIALTGLVEIGRWGWERFIARRKRK